MDLEKLEHSLAYKDRVLMHKHVEVQGGFKNLKPPKKKGSEVKESGRGGAVGGGGVKIWENQFKKQPKLKTSFQELY